MEEPSLAHARPANNLRPFSRQILVQEHGQLLHGYPKVGFVELVGNVPPDGPIQPAFLDKSVEKAQPEEEPPEFRTYLAAGKHGAT